MALENLTKDVEKLNIEEKYDTNWCDMPAEIKMKCIESLELKERLCLRATARTEKALVDSQRVENEYLQCHVIKEWTELCISSPTKWNFPSLMFKSTDCEKVASCIELLLHLAKFETLQIEVSPDLNLTDHFSHKMGPLDVKILKLKKCGEKDIFFWLNKIDSRVTTNITLDGNDDGNFKTTFDRLLEVPNLINCPSWQLLDLRYANAARNVALKWIHLDVEIGSTFTFLARQRNTRSRFSSQFRSRIVATNNRKLIRIRTDNPTKHIVLELGMDHGAEYGHRGCFEFYRLRVIPAEQTEREYDYGDRMEWMEPLEGDYSLFADSDDSIGYYDSDWYSD